MSETYLSHPTFGLLSRICVIDEYRSLFTTLYAHRLFFLITTTTTGTQFEPVTRADARLHVENRLRSLRREGSAADIDRLQYVFKRTFT